MAYHKGCECDGKYYILGGQNATMSSVNSVYVYNIEENFLEKLNFKVKIIVYIFKPEEFPPTESQTVNYDPIGKRILIFGGYSMGSFTNNLYSFDIQTRSFTKLEYNSSEVPQGRIGHSASIHENNLYIYAGEQKDAEYFNDMWMLNLSNLNWIEIRFNSDDVPYGRSGHSMIANKDTFYIFGGKKGNLKETNELWRFDISKNEFFLLHDTLLEQFSEKELLEMQPKDEDKTKNQKVFKWVTKKDIPALNPFFRVKYKKKKKKIEKVLSRSQVLFEYRKKWESELLKLPDVSSIQRSTIYKVEDNMEKIQRKLTSSVKTMKNHFSELNIIGNLPFPRDGHSAEFYSNLIIIFGGDRNKFPYNDLYTFIMP